MYNTVLGPTTYSTDILQFKTTVHFFSKNIHNSNLTKNNFRDIYLTIKITSCHLKCLKRKSTTHCAQTKRSLYEERSTLQHFNTSTVYREKHMQKPTVTERHSNSRYLVKFFQTNQHSKISLHKDFTQNHLTEMT